MADGGEASNMLASLPMPSGLTDRELLELLWQKMMSLDCLKVRVAKIETKVEEMENNVRDLDTRIQELDEGTSYMENDFMDLKSEVKEMKEQMISVESFNEIKSEIVDMSNRIRRNNIVLHNVPEGVEDEEGCTSFVQNLVKGTLGVEAEIEVAHRTPGQKPIKDSRPRLIHA